MDEIKLIAIGLISVCAFISVTQLQNDMVQLHHKLDRIAKHIGMDETETVNIDPELKELILEGKKIKAIKRYRAVTGLGLKEAKEYVDKLSES